MSTSSAWEGVQNRGKFGRPSDPEHTLSERSGNDAWRHGPGTPFDRATIFLLRGWAETTTRPMGQDHGRVGVVQSALRSSSSLETNLLTSDSLTPFSSFLSGSRAAGICQAPSFA